jgi:cell division topological specificity factor
MLDIFRKLNWLSAFFPKEESAKRAKERLRLVLIQDQASISPGLMNLLRDEMIGVVSRYLEIDSAHLELGLERRNNQMALAASIPVLRVRRETGVVPEDNVQEEMLGQQSPTNNPKTADPSTEKHYRRNRRRYR